MARSKSSRQWLARQQACPYVKQAQKLGYRSRAAFKLIEIQEKYQLFNSGMRVLDLGAAPGGFAQLASQWVGDAGQVVAIDRLKMDRLPGVQIIHGDLEDNETFAELERMMINHPVDLVMSDMAPNISGNKTRDQAVAMRLIELAASIAADVLRPGGCFVVKMFQGAGFDAFVKEMRQSFAKVMIFKPKASRSQSRESYLIADGYHNMDNQA